jgi:hypothetical protein
MAVEEAHVDLWRRVLESVEVVVMLKRGTHRVSGPGLEKCAIVCVSCVCRVRREEAAQGTSMTRYVSSLASRTPLSVLA